jgi:undecaprenyl diphosphate synthase
MNSVHSSLESSERTHLSSPAHIACIMDGNGRWARARGMDRTIGHAAGERAILEFIDLSLEFGVSWVSLFAFSTENWLRPPAEVAFLMEFNSRVINRHGPRFHAQGVRVRYMGAGDSRIPRKLWRQMRDIEEMTAKNERMTLTMAFNHGGRSELVEATRRIVSSGIPEPDISEELISGSLPYSDMPDPDLVIRTAGEHRLSNFALWRCAYSELIFTETLWPDFSRRDFLAALDEYSRRTRTFGKLDAVPGDGAC